MSDPSFPAPGAVYFAEKAILELPENIRTFYHAEYYIAFGGANTDRHGKFAGVVCNACNHWREYGHGNNCPVSMIEHGKSNSNPPKA